MDNKNMFEPHTKQNTETSTDLHTEAAASSAADTQPEYTNVHTESNTAYTQTHTDQAKTFTQANPEHTDTFTRIDIEHAQTSPKQDKKKKKGSFFQRHHQASVLGGCLVLAAAGGFGGTMAAFAINGNSGKTVLYESVTGAKIKNTNAEKEGAMSVKQVVEATAQSVVEIKTESVSTHNFYSQAITSGAGSGVILSKDGYIVTNHHVIEGANKVTVTTKDGKSYNAALVGTDSTTDLAVIKINADNLTPAVMGSSDELEVGDTAIAIGNPLGELGGTVTSGIISALDRQITIDGENMHLLQTSAAINPGNSGGGLFNDQGELIGIVNAKSGGDNIEGLGFAIPIDRAKSIIKSLIENGRVEGRPSLGVTLTQTSNPLSNGEEAIVYISQIEKGKAADQAGLQVGDQILKADGESISSIEDLKEQINGHKAGEKMTFTVLRDNETKEIEVTLGEATTDPSQAQEQNTQDFSSGFPFAG